MGINRLKRVGVSGSRSFIAPCSVHNNGIMIRSIWQDYKELHSLKYNNMISSFQAKINVFVSIIWKMYFDEKRVRWGCCVASASLYGWLPALTKPCAWIGGKAIDGAREKNKLCATKILLSLYVYENMFYLHWWKICRYNYERI